MYCTYNMCIIKSRVVKYLRKFVIRNFRNYAQARQCSKIMRNYELTLLRVSRNYDVDISKIRTCESLKFKKSMVSPLIVRFFRLILDS
jgi:hypothetical protein